MVRLPMRPVDSLSSFVSAVNRTQKRWGELELWFRGVKSRRFRLEPSLYRGRDWKRESTARVKEDEARIEFSRRAVALYLSPVEPKEFDWYVLMRHSRIATRLLDWTEGALLALYFAVQGSDHPEPGIRRTDAAVWVLDPEWLNEIVTGRRNNLLTSSAPELQQYLPEPRQDRKYGLKPVAVLPRYMNPRMLAQRSVFTIQGPRDAFDEFLAKKDKRLVQIIVKRKSCVEILEQLSLCGIDQTTVFPDMDSLGSDISANFIPS